MPIAVAVISTDSAVAARLAALVPADGFTVSTHHPEALPTAMPGLFVIALPDIETPEEQVIEHLRADDATANIPIIIASALPMVQLQSVPYASDWTIAIVEEPVDAAVLADTMHFLLNPE
jgi:DNA-binding response OmpR family regulator